MDTLKVIEASFLWLEEDLCSSESLTTDQDLPAIRQLVVLLTCVTFLGILLSRLIIIDDKARFFLYIFDDLNFRICCETIASVVKDFLKVRCDVPTGKVNPLDRMRDSITFIYWHSVRNTVTRVEDDTSGSTIRVKCQNRLNADIEARYIENFEHYLGHLLPVFFWVERGLGHEDWMLLW